MVVDYQDWLPKELSAAALNCRLQFQRSNDSSFKKENKVRYRYAGTTFVDPKFVQQRNGPLAVAFALKKHFHRNIGFSLNHILVKCNILSKTCCNMPIHHLSTRFLRAFLPLLMLGFLLALFSCSGVTSKHLMVSFPTFSCVCSHWYFAIDVMLFWILFNIPFPLFT